MPLPNVNASIRNVPMDYFLRGVDAAKPQGAPPAGADPSSRARPPFAFWTPPPSAVQGPAAFSR